MNEPQRRRPIRVRTSSWARAIAAWLAGRNITPNQVSLASLVFAAIGGMALWGAAQSEGARVPLYLLTILAIYGRLLCNLFDGMIAVEGGKASPSGELFNEVPDRLADCLFLIGAGAATGALHGLAIGCIAALGAVMTAYIRTLGQSLGLKPDFSGPMAKPHRMHGLAALLGLAAFLVGIGLDRTVLLIGLGLGAALTWWTVWRRLTRLHQALNSSDAPKS